MDTNTLAIRLNKLYSKFNRARGALISPGDFKKAVIILNDHQQVKINGAVYLVDCNFSKKLETSVLNEVDGQKYVTAV